MNYDKFFKEGETERNTLTEFNSNNTYISVSYTHLDVYKRQIHGTGEGVAHSKRWYVALVRMHHEKKVSEYLNKVGDVYKRQSLVYTRDAYLRKIFSSRQCNWPDLLKILQRNETPHLRKKSEGRL